MIALLLARGATLQGVKFDFISPADEKMERGQITTALMLGRDDLALALLSRDKRVGANDSQALLEAARRGHGSLALALLQAGANARTTDASASTPLMWARKWRDTRLIAALLNAGAPDKPDLPKVPYPPEMWSALGRFSKQSLLIIDDVAVMDVPRVGLEPKGETAFVLYGDTEGKLEQIRCEHTSAYEIFGAGGAGDAIWVGTCKAAAKRVLASAEVAFRTHAKSEPRVAAMWSEMGLMWKREVRPDGVQSFEFPVALIGHGAIFLRTFVLVDKSGGRAVIVQASVDKLCQETPAATPLCTDSGRALAEIAERVARLPQ